MFVIDVKFNKITKVFITSTSPHWLEPWLVFEFLFGVVFCLPVVHWWFYPDIYFPPQKAGLCQYDHNYGAAKHLLRLKAITSEPFSCWKHFKVGVCFMFLGWMMVPR